MSAVRELARYAICPVCKRELRVRRDQRAQRLYGAHVGDVYPPHRTRPRGPWCETARWLVEDDERVP